MSPKEIRARYGVSNAPLQVGADTKVYVKAMEFDSQHAGAIETKSWIVIAGGKLHRSNTYNGNLGRKGNPLAEYNTEVAPTDEKTLARKVKGYELVETSSCPFIEVV